MKSLIRQWPAVLLISSGVVIMPARADVKIHIEVAPAAGECLAGAELIAIPDQGTPVTIPTNPARNEYSLRLAETQEWSISLRKADCWSETRRWTADDESGLTLTAYAAAAAESTLEAPRGTKLRGVKGIVSVLASAVPMPESATSCSLDGTRWHCAVPAGVTFDLRLEVPGFSAVYYWDVVAGAQGRRVLEPAALRPGASIIGWVQNAEKKPLAGASVTLIPLQFQGNSRRDDLAGRRMRGSQTNKRGFFQIAGLDAGHYRIVSEASGWSAAIIAEVELRTGEAVKLPFPILHAPIGEADIVFEPAADPQGRPWRVEVTEVTPLLPGEPPRTSLLKAGLDGRVVVEGLRVDLYEVVVRDGDDAVALRTEIDLYEGGRRTILLAIHALRIRGAVRAGDDPLEADLHLAHPSAGVVRMTADEKGRFEGILPAAGTWAVTVLYPHGAAPARIEASPVRIAEDAQRGSLHEIEVQLPGGRIRGEVIGDDGQRDPAVVHLFRGGRIVAQQRTNGDGRFDLVGLSAGDYQVDAQSAAGSTPAPLDVRIEEDETAELTLKTAPVVLVSGYVLTPDGLPASGASIQMSVDGGRSWSGGVAGLNGYFERPLSRGTTAVQMIVLTYDYPATVLSTAITREPLRIQLPRQGGLIRFGDRASVSARGVVAPAYIFHFPEPLGRFGGAIYVEPGLYTLCPSSRSPREDCHEVVVQPGSTHNVDLQPRKKQEEEGRT